MTPAQAFIGLGSNLGDAAATLRSAVACLRKLPGSRVTGLSSLYRSTPLGPPGQDDYLNAVARLETVLTPHSLLQALHIIEDRHGRVRQQRWGARTLDLDLLLYGNDVITSPDLTLPHPEMLNRNFVLIPLLDIAPDQALPDGRRVREASTASDRSGLSELYTGPSWSN
ncbi:MAG: 2-amino-4-hydroxy-6-hydroxymethyldihydropteridine pyrophosphokinae [Moraxellaceae bacterium]|jgi:2-amino-4-hydroxy-6-hydroxymethyldihydropteridine diphosphokinase|nr:2-amino-4-hydroxy-6-hydroxymethyldihydropteridine pyrophosphokinae [Moraxellaceae bacterium]